MNQYYRNVFIGLLVTCAAHCKHEDHHRWGDGLWWKKTIKQCYRAGVTPHTVMRLRPIHVTHFLESLFLFLHTNSWINYFIFNVFYLIYIQLGMMVAFYPRNMYFQGHIHMAFSTVMVAPLLLKISNETLLRPNLVLQVIQIGYISLLLFVAWIVKTRTQRPSPVYARIFIILIETMLVLYFTVGGTPLNLTMIQQMSNFMQADCQDSIAVRIFISLVSIAVMVINTVLWWYNTTTFEDYRLTRPCSFFIRPYFTMQITFILIMTVVSFVASGHEIAMQLVIMGYNIVLVITLCYLRVFAFMYSSIHVHGLVVFLCLSIAANCLNTVVLSNYQTQKQLEISVITEIFVLLATSAIVWRQTRVFLPMVGCALGQQRKQACKQAQHSPRVTIDYSISREFVLDLLAFFGPEYCGMLEKKEADFLLGCEYQPLQEEELAHYTQRVRRAEDALESFKLLYEAIYANIFYTYDLCGQSLEHLTILDIEEALPVPELLRLARMWRTPTAATSGIISLLKQLRDIDGIMSVGKVQCGSAQRCRRGRMVNMSRLMEENDIDIESIQRHAAALSARSRNKNASLQPERALWKSNYTALSDGEVRGGLFLLSTRDCIEAGYLFRHHGARLGRMPGYVYVPSYTSQSEATGNVHRLSFACDGSHARTAQLRRVYCAAALSLARLLHPLAGQLDGRVALPLGGRWTVRVRGSTRARLGRGVAVRYAGCFELRPGGRARPGAGRLYRLAPLFADAAQQQHVDATLLQTTLVEAFLSRLVATRRADARMHRFLQAFGNRRLTASQKLRLCVPQARLDASRLDAVRRDTCQNAPDAVVYNAAAVLFGCAAIDRSRAATAAAVTAALRRSQFYLTRGRFAPYYAGYLGHLRAKLGLYRAAYRHAAPPALSAALDAAACHADDLAAYMRAVADTFHVPAPAHYDAQLHVAQMLSALYPVLVGLIGVKCPDDLESDQLLLLHDPMAGQEHQEDDAVQYPECNYHGVVQLFSHTHSVAAPLLRFNQYNFVKLSNLVHTLELQLRQNHFSHDNQPPENPYKPGYYLQNPLHALQIVNQLLATDDTVLNGCDKQPSLSNSISTDSISNSDDIAEANQTPGLNSMFFDVNLQNPHQLDDFISTDNNNCFNIDNDNAIFTCHELNQNTPEFVINAVRSDFANYYEDYGSSLYLQLLILISTLHCIKLNDSSVRSINTVCYIILHIQQRQDGIETMITHFLNNLIAAKHQQNQNNNLLLFQAMNSIQVIETAIKKLHQTRAMLLRRENLSEDHILLMQSELRRALLVTYGYPDLLIPSCLTIRKKLLTICDTFSGLKRQYTTTILNQIESMPRCGGVYYKNTNYIFRRHSTWRMRFKWESCSFKDRKSSSNAVAATCDVQGNTPQKGKAKRGVCRNTCMWHNYLNYALTILIAVIAVITFVYNMSRSITYKSALNIIQEVEQGVSQSLFELNNMADSLYLTAMKGSLLQNDSYYINQRLGQFQRIVDRAFENYLYLQSYATGLKTRDVYAEEIVHQRFKYDLSRLQNSHPDDTSICGLTIQVGGKPRNGFGIWSLSLTGGIQNDSYRFSSYKNINMANIPQQHILERTFELNYDGISQNVSIMQALTAYTNIINCYAQNLLQNLYNAQNINVYTTATNSIQGLELSYQQDFVPAYNMIINDYAQRLRHQCMYVALPVIILVTIITYIMIHHINTHFQSRILANDIDKGSIIQRISQIPVGELEMILQTYKTTIQKTQRKSNSATRVSNINTNIEYDNHGKTRNPQEKLFNQLTPIFQSYNHNIMLFLSIAAAVLFCLQLGMKCTHLVYPIRLADTNLENQFSQLKTPLIEYVPHNKIFDPREPGNFAYLLFKYQRMPSNHPVYSALTYAITWIEHFERHNITWSHAIEYMSPPSPQLNYIITFIRCGENSINNEEKAILVAMVRQLRAKVCDIMANQRRSLVKSGIISEIHLSTYNAHCRSYRHDFVERYTHGEIIERFQGSIYQTVASIAVYTGAALYILYSVVAAVPVFFVVYKVIRYIGVPFRSEEDRGDENMKMYKNMLLGRLNWVLIWMNLILVLGVELYQVFLTVQNIIFVARYHKTFQTFASGMYPQKSIQLLTDYKCFVVLHTATICLYALYDAYTSNALTLICSLGNQKDAHFITPQKLKTRRNMALGQVLKGLIWLYGITIIVFVCVGARQEMYGLQGFLHSKTVSMMNQEAIILQQTLSMRQNSLYANSQYFRSQSDMGMLYLEQRDNLRELVNLNNYINVSQHLIINQLADDRWAESGTETNLATQSYEQTNHPSFIYGINSIDEFQRLMPPRTHKFGAHLDGSSSGTNTLPLMSMMVSHQYLTRQATYYTHNTLLEAYIGLTANNDKGLSQRNASMAERYVINYQKLMLTDLPLRNQIINNIAYRELDDDTASGSEYAKLLCLAFALVTVTLGLVVAVLHTALEAHTRDFLLRNNLFTSLFLKRMLGVDNRGGAPGSLE